MMENMFTVMRRINELKKRFGLMRHNVNPASTQNNRFQQETQTRIREMSGGVTGTNRQSSARPSARPSVSLNTLTRQGRVTMDNLNRDVSNRAIRDIVEQYARTNNVSSNLVNAIIETESNFNPRAVSSRGAMGLMQLMPGLARQLNVQDPFEPEQNIRGGVTHLRRLMDKYRGDYRKALAAYNAGERAVDEHNGIPPFRETQEYVRKVMDSYLRNRQ